MIENDITLEYDAKQVDSPDICRVLNRFTILGLVLREQYNHKMRIRSEQILYLHSTG